MGRGDTPYLRTKKLIFILAATMFGVVFVFLAMFFAQIVGADSAYAKSSDVVLDKKARTTGSEGKIKIGAIVDDSIAFLVKRQGNNVLLNTSTNHIGGLNVLGNGINTLAFVDSPSDGENVLVENVTERLSCTANF